MNDDGSSLDQKLWRYMDLPKFVSLLSSRSLWFARADTFEDKWEAFSREVPYPIDGGNSTAEDHLRTLARYHELIQTHRDWRRKLVRQLFVNCWVRAEYESVAMWKIYGSYAAGIAVQTTVGRFRRSVQFPRELPALKMDSVQYYIDLPPPRFDYPKGTEFSWDAALEVALQKRACFEFEQEWRAVIWGGTQLRGKGVQIPVVIPSLVEQVYVSPLASKNPPPFDWVVYAALLLVVAVSAVKPRATVVFLGYSSGIERFAQPC